MESRYIIDAGRDEKGNARLLKVTAACKQPSSKLPNAAVDLCVGEGFIAFDQSNLVRPVAVQHVIY